MASTRPLITLIVAFRLDTSFLKASSSARTSVISSRRSFTSSAKGFGDGLPKDASRNDSEFTPVVDLVEVGEVHVGQQVPYKSHLLEAISDGCQECNDVERHMLKVFIQTVKGLKNGDYELLKAKFDPNNHMDTTFSDVARF